MIFARDKSQMCNNLLQFAHVYAWGREHGRRVMSMRFSYKYKYFKISHSKYVSFSLYLFAKYMAALRLLPTASFKHAEYDMEALEQKMLHHKHIVVSGWYARWYDLFLKYRSEICELFKIDDVYASPVRIWMKREENDTVNSVRLGVHIRRGDYATWGNGIYYYDDEKYIDFIRQFACMKTTKKIDVYISTNDSDFNFECFKQKLRSDDGCIALHLFGGNAAQDLFMLSECDYIIGPPSTYSLVAAMYRDIPLCRMDQVREDGLCIDDFKLFEYWFKRIV